MSEFQQLVKRWVLACFGKQAMYGVVERRHRFLEEALELSQACECTADEAHQLVDYVFNRPVGEKAQEVGGVMVTLAALCSAQELDMMESAYAEINRISAPAVMVKIKAKRDLRPANSPLPGPTVAD